MEKWRCPICGFIHDGELPKDFVCPRCGRSGSIFERMNGEAKVKEQEDKK